jgi:hypothetical protein
MIKLSYTFKALQPIFTGSDENYGTERKFRREKTILSKPIKVKSKFPSIADKRKAVVDILLEVWKHIDFENMSNTRMMKIYNEFTSKVLAATSVRTKEEFINKLCEKFGIRSLSNPDIVKKLNKFDNDEFLDLLREETQYLILIMRAIKQDKKQSSDEALDLFDVQEEVGKVNYEKYYDTVPVISGNSIRGILRRLLMYDFCKHTGIDKLEKKIYHQLFTGGNLTGSTAQEKIGEREKFQKMCPPIWLLGAATEGQILEGELKVGRAKLKCKENENGNISYWELIEMDFGTRLDSSKNEDTIKIAGFQEETSQMLYQNEMIVSGAEFEHVFVLQNENNSLLQSCFWRMIELFKENNFIGGNSARGYGMIEIPIQIPKNASEEYLEYLNSNKDEIKKYFQEKTI